MAIACIQRMFTKTTCHQCLEQQLIISYRNELLLSSVLKFIALFTEEEKIEILLVFFVYKDNEVRIVCCLLGFRVSPSRT